MQSMTILFLCPSTFKYWDHLWLKSVLHIWLADKQRTSSSRTMRNVTEDSSSCFRLSLEVVLFLDSLRVWMSMYVILHWSRREVLTEWSWALPILPVLIEGNKEEEKRRRQWVSPPFCSLRAYHHPASVCAELDTKMCEEALLNYEQEQVMPLPLQNWLLEIDSELLVQSWIYSNVEDTTKELAGQFSI